jgi:transcriptional regulator of NAD metabolism
MAGKSAGGGNHVDAAQRREGIRRTLQESSAPVSAGALARKFGVSRQVIVGDVALLRAANVPISATPRGYVMQKEAGKSGLIRTIACCHDKEGITQELYTVVDNGCGVLDVIVEHAAYGQISGQLQAFSRYDVDCFVKKLAKNESLPLCNLTGGVHLHTILCPDEDAYRRVLKQLKEKGFLFEKESSEE